LSCSFCVSTTPLLLFFLFLLPPPPTSALFPYTTLFRSSSSARRNSAARVRPLLPREFSRYCSNPVFHFIRSSGDGSEIHLRGGFRKYFPWRLAVDENPLPDFEVDQGPQAARVITVAVSVFHNHLTKIILVEQSSFPRTRAEHKI